MSIFSPVTRPSGCDDSCWEGPEGPFPGRSGFMKAPTSGPPSEEKAEVLCLQTGPTQTQWLVPNGCPVCDCLLAPFPPANARLVRTLIYISLGGVRLGVKERSCSSLNPEFPEQHSAVIPRQPTQWPSSPFQSRAQNHLNKIRLHLLSPLCQVQQQA